MDGDEIGGSYLIWLRLNLQKKHILVPSCVLSAGLLLSNFHKGPRRGDESKRTGETPDRLQRRQITSKNQGDWKKAKHGRDDEKMALIQQTFTLMSKFRADICWNAPWELLTFFYENQLHDDPLTQMRIFTLHLQKLKTCQDSSGAPPFTVGEVMYSHTLFSWPWTLVESRQKQASC